MRLKLLWKLAGVCMAALILVSFSGTLETKPSEAKGGASATLMLEDVIYAAWPEGLAPTAGGVVSEESAGDPYAVGADGERGLFQISHVACVSVGCNWRALFDPYYNAEVAYDVYLAAQEAWGFGWDPWTTYPPAPENIAAGHQTAIKGFYAPPEGSTPTSASAGPQRASQEGVYVAKEGDTLSGIAEYLGVPLKYLVTVNPQIADPDLIYVGEEVYY